MSSKFPTLIVLGILGAGTPAAACRWFGTQVLCDQSRVVIGTQAAKQPSDARSLRPYPFQGTGGLAEGHVATSHPVQLQVQDIGADPSLCRRIGNETYCY